MTTDRETEARQPTDLRPGSAEKIALLELRLSLGIDLHQPGDRFEKNAERPNDAGWKWHVQGCDAETQAQMLALARRCAELAAEGLSVKQIAKRTKLRRETVIDVLIAIRSLGLPE